jgi:hypothetical protein
MIDQDFYLFLYLYNVCEGLSIDQVLHFSCLQYGIWEGLVIDQALHLLVSIISMRGLSNYPSPSPLLSAM